MLVKHALLATLAFACVALVLAREIQHNTEANSSVASLGAYNVDIHRTSVSGLSAGAYFAVQMHIAYSSIIVGSGIFAGGPYDCAEGAISTATTSCMKGVPAPKVSSYVTTTNARATNGDIDPTSYLTSDKVFMFSGTLDTTVHQSVMDALSQYYQTFISASQISYENSIAAAHTMPTIDHDENPCDKSKTPFISYCNYDGAGKALQQIYGSLNAPNTGVLSGQLVEFDQSEFIPDPTSKSMAATGWLYVPNNCAQNQSCILHVSFHGCEQDYASIGDEYISNAGFNAWADTNNMIILYPQTVKSYTPYNPNACFDWWGYNNDPTSYDTKSGVQMKGAFAMINRIASGFISLVAPTGLEATSVQNHSISLQWSPVKGANGYVVIRNGVQVASTINLYYNDTGLASATLYTYQVAGIAQSGALGQFSSSISVTTTGIAPPLAVPTGLAISGVTSSSVTVEWDAVLGASNYYVYRNNSRVGTNVTDTTYEDEGLSATTVYSYTVSAVNAAGKEGPISAPIDATTTSSFECKTYTSNNYDQVKTGRAYEKLGLCYAVGSNDSMGLYNIFIITTLAETAQDYYYVGQCPGSSSSSSSQKQNLLTGHTSKIQIN